MMNHFESPSGPLLRAMLRGAGGFASPQAVLQEISSEEALALSHPGPHSIAAITAHIDFWQTWVLDAIRGSPQGLPESAKHGWPEIEAKAWPELVSHVLRTLEQFDEVTHDTELLKRLLSPDMSLGGHFDRHTVGSALSEVIALHNAYHLGQIVLLRRNLGLWPPKAGGVTW